MYREESLAMSDQKTEIARKYLLPERPFLHGMASAFDMFGVLNAGKRERLLANLEEDLERSDRDVMRSAWQQVGETLYLTMKQHGLLSSGSRGK
jgi:hypothetical protein